MKLHFSSRHYADVPLTLSMCLHGGLNILSAIPWVILHMVAEWEWNIRPCNSVSARILTNSITV